MTHYLLTPLHLINLTDQFKSKNKILNIQSHGDNLIDTKCKATFQKFLTKIGIAYRYMTKFVIKTFKLSQYFLSIVCECSKQMVSDESS